MQTIGFGGDLEANTVGATEDVRKNYLKKYPKGKKHKKKGLAKYDILSKIFCGTLATWKWAIGPHAAAKIGGAVNKSVQEVEPEEEIDRDSYDILNTPPAKVKATKGGSCRLKKKSASKSLVKSIQQWSKSQATKSEAFIRAQEEFYHYIAEKRAHLVTAYSCDDVEDSILTCMGTLNAIEDLEDRVCALAVQELAMKKEMRLAFINVPLKHRRGFLLNIFR